MKKLLLTLFLFPTLIIAQIQIGQDINGESMFNQFGDSVSLSSDGSVIAIGASFNNGSSNNSGHVRVYENIGGMWTQIGSDIDGEGAGDRSGFSVALSSDGSILAIGTPLNNANGTQSGEVRVFDLSSVLSTESFNLDYFTIYPNPAQHDINIKLNQSIELKKVNIYNTLGQFISTTQDLKINTSSFTNGVYFIEIETNKGKSAKKIVIE